MSLDESVIGWNRFWMKVYSTYFYPSWTPHIFTKLLHAPGNFSCSIPRPIFARMKSDASVLEEVVRQEIMDITFIFFKRYIGPHSHECDTTGSLQWSWCSSNTIMNTWLFCPLISLGLAFAEFNRGIPPCSIDSREQVPPEQSLFWSTHDPHIIQAYATHFLTRRDCLPTMARGTFEHCCPPGARDGQSIFWEAEGGTTEKKDKGTKHGLCPFRCFGV